MAFSRVNNCPKTKPVCHVNCLSLSLSLSSASFYLQEEEEMNSLVPILRSSQVTTIDVTQLHHEKSHTKPLVVKSIHDACFRYQT